MRLPSLLLTTSLLVAASPVCPSALGAPPDLPRWLHVEPRPPSSSSVPASLLTLDDERHAHYVEEGFHTADLLRRFELMWKGDTVLTCRTTRLQHYLTDEGVRQEGNLGVSVRTDVEELWIDEAWIAQPTGERRPVDLNSIQLVTVDSYDVFSDSVRVVIPFDGLTAGATAVLVTRVVERPDDWPLPWSDLFFPQVFSPVERFELEMSWDPSLRQRALITDAPFLECSSTPGHVRCQAERIPAVAGASDSTLWSDVLPQVVVTGGGSWADLAEAERRLFETSLARDEGVAESVRALVGGVEDVSEKLERLHRFVADEVRYLGLEHGPAAVAPATVERTLDARYGDCKGKVALFVAMARQAGLRAYPVVVATARNDLGKLLLPSWRYFDHVIACVELGIGNAPLCMDLTTPNAATGSLPPGLYGSVALDLKEGVTAPRIIETAGPVFDMEVRTRNAFDCTGGLMETTERVFRGPSAVWERGALRGLTAEERTGRERGFFAEDIEPELSFSGLEDPSAPVETSSAARYLDVLGEDEDEYVEYDRWLHYYAERFSTENEVHPAWVPGVRIRSLMTFAPCPADRIDLVGAELDMRSDFGTLTRRYRREGRELKVDTEFELRTQTVAGQNLSRFRRFFEGALDQSLVWFRLQRGGS